MKLLLVGAVGAGGGMESLPFGSLLPATATNPVLSGLLVLGPFGVTYFGVTAALGVPHAKRVVRGSQRRVVGRRRV